MVDPIIATAGIEALKLGIQFLIAQARMNGVSEEEIDGILNTERERFRKNIAIPLKDV